MTDKSHMFWGQGNIDLAYADGIPIPIKTYRCKGAVTVVNGLLTRKHLCKKVTDHPGSCLCICDRDFNIKEEESV